MSAARLLVVDDDGALRERLLRAFAARGLDARGAGQADEALRVAGELAPTHAVLDLRMPGRSGLELLSELLERWPELRALVLTGYGSIATAVASVRQGAVDYLSKPADADAVEAALLQRGPTLPPPPEQPMTADRVRWEHIQRVFEQCDRNVSETARRLRMHRRTLQRILAKYAPRG